MSGPCENCGARIDPYPGRHGLRRVLGHSLRGGGGRGIRRMTRRALPAALRLAWIYCQIDGQWRLISLVTPIRCYQAGDAWWWR